MSRNRTVWILAISLASLLAGAVLAFEAWHADRIYPGVRVGGVPLGGKRPAEAAALLQERLGAPEHPPILLRGPDRSWTARPVDLGFSLAAEETAWMAFQAGRGSDDTILDHLRLLLQGYDLDPLLSFDPSQARLYLRTLAEQIDLPPVDADLRLEGGTVVMTPARTGRMLDVEASVAAVQAAMGGTPGEGVEVTLVVRELPPQVTEAEEARTYAESLLSQPFALVLSAPREGDPGPWFLSPEELATMLQVQPVDGRLQVVPDESAWRAYLESLAPALAIEPVDARFHFDEATGQLVPIAPSAEGRALDVEASLQNVLHALEEGQHAAPLALRAVPPRYPDTATAEELGIRELVAEGDSYFIGSPSGRDHNIRLAASKFDGIVIPPGGIFSFNHYLGEVSAEAGYDEAYITAGEQLAIEVGGGICQVSTTAFRAALWGGYPIVERWYHHHRVGYYELMGYGPGFDATIYSPQVDFKFRNDRDAALLIETEIEDDAHRLIFRFYSTDDGREVKVEGPVITDETEPGPPIYQLDESMEPGTVVQWQSAQNGLTATVERWVYDAAGNLLYHDLFVSRYAPRRAVYRYGPGYQPP
ncbi:MAG TPA: hypothetical protein G4O00_14805 [Thermoflexia bacterium]|nr:hypothetical protein [Thermoflexia bacterium]